MQKEPNLFPETLMFDHQDGAFVTTSLMIAKRFGRKHKHVLRAIKNLQKNIPDPAFSWANFVPQNYLDSQNKVQPMYLLTKDGFYILSMGFTGEEALKIKLRLMRVFIYMESRLLRRMRKESVLH